MRVEFLEDGSDDCPLIRFYVTDQKSFAQLHRQIERLARGTTQFYRLHDDAALDMSDGLELTLLATDNGGVRQMDDRRFIWELAPEKWLLVAGLIEPFAGNLHTGGFQWLAGREARYGLDVGDINVVLSCSVDGAW